MRFDTALRWSWTGILTRKRLLKLYEHFDGPDAAMGRLDEDLLHSLGCRPETVPKVLGRMAAFNPALYEQTLLEQALMLLTIEDARYPAVLLEIPDAPVFLTAKGDLSVLQQPCIALVGTRDMSAYGKRVVEKMVPAIAASGAVTISGLAMGIDAEVARITMENGGRTVAVLGHGLGMIYPKENTGLADTIVERGGLLLSEFPLDTEPDRYTFPSRNRIIAGLSLGTVVIEAATDSGSLRWLQSSHRLRHGKAGRISR